MFQALQSGPVTIQVARSKPEEQHADTDASVLSHVRGSVSLFVSYKQPFSLCENEARCNVDLHFRTVEDAPKTSCITCFRDGFRRSVGHK